MAIEVQCGGDAEFFSAFFSKELADYYFDVFLNTLDWRKEHYTIYGREIVAPRLMCWYGDPGAVYTYSGVEHVPLAWTPELVECRQKIEQAAQVRFNSVLGNLYRDGQDSMGWHADKEPELGRRPVIASLSLGETRLFKLRNNQTAETVDLELTHGSLLIMKGDLQHDWKHCVPKTRRPKSARINLTFRCILN